MTICNLLNTLTNNTPLPMELWLKIVYKHKGFITPSALLIKNHFEKINPTALLIKKHMKKNKLTEYTQISFYFKEYNSGKYHLGDGAFDTSDYFITRDLINTNDPEELNKFSFSWEQEVNDLVDMLD